MERDDEALNSVALKASLTSTPCCLQKRFKRCLLAKSALKSVIFTVSPWFCTAFTVLEASIAVSTNGYKSTSRRESRCIGKVSGKLPMSSVIKMRGFYNKKLKFKAWTSSTLVKRKNLHLRLNILSMLILGLRVIEVKENTIPVLAQNFYWPELQVSAFSSNFPPSFQPQFYWKTFNLFKLTW